jgi:small subunit ribosomal protein S1
MSESFIDLFEQQLSKMPMVLGAIIQGTVVKITDDFVIVDAGLKSEGVVPIEQFYNDAGDLEIAVGDLVDVALDSFEDGFGETRLSREKAKRAESWKELARAFEANETVTGIINGKVKGGFTVEINTIRAFLPGSLVDVRPMRDTTSIEGKELEFRVIKLDAKRNNVVVSRRAVVENEGNAERSSLLENLQEGQSIRGVVKNLTDYGAFVDLGGVDGLLHITDMSWKRVKHPSEVVAVGDEVDVKVLKFDRERSRVSLGMKQMGEDPWDAVVRKYPEGTKLSGKVTNITDYGCFVEIENGVEGLVHVSEMDWTNKNIHPSKVVQLEQEVEVVVLDVDQERRRISLGIKQCSANPWEDFAGRHNKNDRVVGKIKSITDFGIFVGLDGAIDGLVHLSDISWNETGEEAIRHFKKGDEIEAIILGVDAERERISLGIKQLEQDPYANFVAVYDKGAIVKGKVSAVETKGATIDLGEGVEGYLRASEISRERIEDARNHLTVGQEVEAKVIGLDRKNRTISLSIKAKDTEEEADAIQQYQRTADVGTGSTLGDLLKNKFKKSDE